MSCKSYTAIVIIIKIFLFPVLTANEIKASDQKVLICGICRNVANAMDNNIKNIEELGASFADYAVIIYENNSTDLTVPILMYWASVNSRVNFVSEMIPTEEMAPARTMRIANARNNVLRMAQDSKYNDYKYLIMADMDFKHPWPIKEIVKTIESEIDWDCVSANGIYPNGDYLDRYAFRDRTSPLGPEVIGQRFWKDVCDKPNKFTGEKWFPVYSGFGGLAIYKTASMIQFSYSGVVTNEMEAYYKKIIGMLPNNHSHVICYMKKNKIPYNNIFSEPINFRNNSLWDNIPLYTDKVTCCEHVAMHAMMFLQGYDKFYVNPKMIMRY